MKDIFSINYQYLIMARDAAKSNSGELLSGIPRSILDKLSEMSVEEIGELAQSAGVSLLGIRLSESEMIQLMNMPKSYRTTYVVSRPTRRT